VRLFRKARNVVHAMVGTGAFAKAGSAKVGRIGTAVDGLATPSPV